MKHIIYIVSILISILSAVLAALGFAAGLISPVHYEWLGFFGLILTPVLFVNMLMAIILLFYESMWSLLPIGALILNVGYISAMFQFTLPDRKIEEGKEKIKVATYNVNNFYTNGVYTLLPVAKYMQDQKVDILCLQEFPNATIYSRDSILNAFSYLPYHCLSDNSHSSMTIAIFSRYPIKDCQTIFFAGSNNLALTAYVDINGRTVQVFSNHLQTTSVNAHKSEVKESLREKEGRRHAAFSLAWNMKENFIHRANQADTIRSRIEGSPYPVIVCGDFNDTPASYTYRRLKRNLTDGFKDCGNGYGYTFRGLYKLFRIDYILYSSGFRGLTYYSPDFPWSDHKPVIWEGGF